MGFLPAIYPPANHHVSMCVLWQNGRFRPPQVKRYNYQMVSNAD